MKRGKIAIENLSGGELTSVPLLATPSKFSRLLKNFYINSKGHIKKVPGWSAVSQKVTDIKITSGIDFKKSDGTSIIMVGGRVDSGVNQNTEVFTAGTDIPDAVFSGSGVDDITSGGTFTGTASAVFELKCVQQGTGIDNRDFIDWRKDGGEWHSWNLSADQPEMISLSDGVTVTCQTSFGHTVNDTWTITIVYPSLDDLTPSGTCTASGVTDFDVEVDSIGATDTFKWRKNDGDWTEGVAMTGAAQVLSDGIYVTFAATTAHSYGSSWVITSSPIMGAVYRLDYGILSTIKSDFASLDPIYFSQIGDVVLMSNNSDRPVIYDGLAVSNVNVPFGNSVEFSGTGLNDFSATITFTYASNTYEVEVDAVGALTITPTYTGTGKNDLTVPSPNYSGAAATAAFEVEIDGTGSGDTFKYNINSGTFVAGNALTTAETGTSIAGIVRLKASATVGHSRDDYYEFQIVSATLFKYRKNGGAWSADTTLTTYPTYAGIGDGYSIAFDVSPTVGDIYKIQVDGATTPNTYKWQKDAEGWTLGVDITDETVELVEGISIRFAYFTGHVSGSDNWTFAVSRDTVQYRDITGAWTTGALITGALQEIIAGVQFKFTAINGHTLGDKWTIPITQNVRLGKSYVYKGRAWAIGNDRLTAYFSVLNLPSDFVGTGSGYLDFRYVIPKGDEMLDIGSVLNYLAFFFKNHIVVYAGTDPTASGDFVIQQRIDDLGVVAADCVVSVGSDIFFLTPRGVKGLKQVLNTGAMDVNNVSAPIDSDIVAAIAANTIGVYSSAHYQKLGLVMFQIGYTIFIFNYRNNSWSRIVVPSTNDVSKILSMFQSSAGKVYMGGYDYLFQFDPAVATYNFNGQAPVYQWTGPMWKATTADSLFLTEMVLRLASTAAATLTLKIRAVGFDTGVEDQAAFNEQTITVSAITTNDAVFNFVRAAIEGAGKYVQIDITETPTYVSNGDVEIAAVEINGELGIL